MVWPQPLARTLEMALYVAPLGVLALILVAAGQPLFTDDLWWHLALGRAYAVDGPWLDADPLLFTALGPPAPAAWLSDLGLAGVQTTFGLAGLRVFHVVLVGGILALVWSLLRRAGGSRWGTSAATAVFAAMAAYRLVQLRPHLATILATLVLYRLVLEGARQPGRGRFAAAIAVLGLWANLHGGFLLGPALLLAAAVAWLLQAARSATALRRLARQRGLLLGVTFLLGLAATGLNPSGFDRHAGLFSTGNETPALSVVVDEWARIDPFSWPVPDLPPSPLTWFLFWGLCLATPLSAIALLRQPSPRESPEPAADLTLVLLAVGALAAMIFAVRFTWLCIFPLLLITSAVGARGQVPQLSRVWHLAARLAVLPLLPAFVFFGAWPMVSRGIPFDSFAQRYRGAYPPEKYNAHAVWFMADTELTGNLFNEYSSGGFLGFWLAPELRSFVNGTLNAPPAAMSASRAIREGRGQQPGESFLALLDRYEIDVFMGVGLPALPRGSRPVSYSTALLEGAPGWLLLFRDQGSAVYLRGNERNRANLERVASYYARNRVPFDPARGFEPSRAIEAALPWAIANGVVPYGIETLRAAVRSDDAAERARGHRHLSRVYGMLGLYQHALRMDRRLLKLRPDDPGTQRRIVWELLRLGRPEEALQSAESLSSGGLDGLLRTAAETLVENPENESTRSLIRRLPILTAREAASSSRTILQPEPRPSRRARTSTTG